MKTVQICVDLDGTLIHTDMLHESAFGLLKAAPLSVAKLPWLLLTKGKAELKQWISKQVDLDPSYYKDFVQWLRTQHALGRRLLLCTASDRSIAESIAKHLGYFDEVMASDGIVNLKR
jgi:phosphoserine phosphatase